MTPTYAQDGIVLFQADCVAMMRALPDNWVDSIVTDPPYGLGFMGAKWDTYANETGRAKSTKHGFDHVGGNHNPSNSADASRTRRVEAQRFGEWCELWTAECLRVLKPGGHLLAFGGTRTWHRLAVAVEDAGFEVRDSIAWLYGSGFPKSLDVSKAIDKAAGAERTVVVGSKLGRPGMSRDGSNQRSGFDSAFGGEATGVMSTDVTAPATPDAARWQGWGTALKPAFEPIVVARKPLIGTVAANVLAHGTGALNIDASRIGTDDHLGRPQGTMPQPMDWGNRSSGETFVTEGNPAGRWPANVVLDEDQADALDQQSGTLKSGANPTRRGSDKLREAYGDFKGQEECTPARGADSGGASRFFYVAKAPTKERPKVDGVAHPTVKPLALMRWLVNLVTPPGGTVLEPFAGSGTTVEACILEGFKCLAIEREDEYLPLILDRIARATDNEGAA